MIEKTASGTHGEGPISAQNLGLTEPNATLAEGSPSDKPTQTAASSGRLILPMPKKVPVKMLFDRMLVAPEVDSAERLSAEGLVIPPTAKGPKRLAWATVVAKGQGVRQINQGDRVLYDPEDKPEVDISGANYVLLKEHDVHGVSQTDEDKGTGLYL